MNKSMIISIFFTFFLATTTHAMSDMDHSKMDHGKMDHGSKHDAGTFTHTTMAGDTHAEFQVMELASMNITDPAGNTHHVMATFSRNGEIFEKVVGKVKLVSPSGEEQIAPLENFGSGVFAANFTIDRPGKWGVICLFKNDTEQHTVKFWYAHMVM